MIFLLFFGNWGTPGCAAQSLSGYMFGRYQEDFLPLLFALRGGWLLWSKRKALDKSDSTPDLRGFLGFAALLTGYLFAKHFGLPELGWASVVGMGWFLALILWGATAWRKLATPVVWLLLATPGILRPLTIPVRVLTAESVSWFLNLAGIPVEEHGTTVVSLGREVWRFTVANECSGARTILTLLFAALLTSEGFPGRGAKTMLVLSAFPLGLGANILRVLGIGLVCHWWGEGAGMQFHQTLWAGAVPLAISLGLLIAIAQALKQRESHGRRSNRKNACATFPKAGKSGAIENGGKPR